MSRLHEWTSVCDPGACEEGPLVLWAGAWCGLEQGKQRVRAGERQSWCVPAEQRSAERVARSGNVRKEWAAWREGAGEAEVVSGKAGRQGGERA